ncbi:L-gulonolactone oxidase-like [Acanthaster planci]|uniref:L-gulonolactone oxidase n=1 Tax=Acanthaster planci TaxID=133434 RepID=A0A8B7ZYV2_ACAPL|nr:L-gulonolactone oxidase-like [Acanthaster planci]XP_022110601.1 L-gulonolactone oxidase-like [Acanthaster planci]XP_022110602.1 L-gulonolactone oxidase-like [Acanthaster planci]
MEGKTVSTWAGSFSCTPELYFEPGSIKEIKQILESARKASKRVRMSGQFHSPSDIAMTDGYMINMKNFNHVIEVDKEKCQITVEGGCIIEDLNTKILPVHGMALSNLGSMPNITIAGAISTGTHGTGIKHGILATQVVQIELLTAQCEILRCSRMENEDLFRAALCSLGCLGVIVTVTIQCEPEFKLHKRQMSCTLDEVLDNLDDHIAKSEFFRFCWYPHTEGAVMWYNDRTQKPLVSSASWFHDYLLVYHILQFLYWVSSFLPRLIPSINRLFYNWCFTGRREDVAISHANFAINCLFRQHVTEWAIPRRHTAVVLRELKSWLNANKDVNVHFPVEVRFVKGDDIMLSPAHGRETCYINIILYRPFGKFVPYAKYWAAFERIVYSVGGRPHWAKAHKLTGAELKVAYPEFEAFCKIRQHLDPQGMFLNDYMERILP